MRTSRRGTFLLSGKIKKSGQLAAIVRNLNQKKKKVVFTNGCFDLLHYGHIKYLSDAKSLGDILIVGLNSDSSVRQIKGKKRPLVNQADRLKIMAALESIDYVTLFYETTPLNLIKKLKPDIIVKGADWDKKNIVGANFVKSYHGRVETIKFIKNRSTTNLINKIAKLYG